MIFEMRTYARDYHERVETRAGKPLLVRMVKPADKEKLNTGFAALSDKSRYTRFFTHKNGLTESELRYFTETDGFDHFAMGAVEIAADGEEGRGVAIARFIRSTKDPKLAEVAITVIDEMQGQGIGRMLLDRLIEAARERGVDRFRFELLGNNEKAKALVRDMCPATTFNGDGNVITAETSLESAPGEGLDDLFAALRLVASRAVLTPLEAGLQGAEAALEAMARGSETLAERVSRSLDHDDD